MKKLCFLFIAAIGCIATHAQPVLSPLTKVFLQDLQTSQKQDAIPTGYIYKRLNTGELCVSNMIKVKDEALTDKELAGINARVGTKAGDIWTVQVPIFKMKEFTTLKGISYIQVDEPVYPKLDSARKTTRVDSVHGGYSLKMPYSGKNVVVGIIDFGFDYNHPTMWDTAGKEYRIKRIWELDATGTPPAGYAYGHESSTEAAIKSRKTDNAEQTHGTAVAGMAAGSGYGNAFTSQHYRGMAYDAEMVMVGVRRDSIGPQWMQGGFSDFVDGINYIFKYAESVHKPAVVNISWGSQSGPHDGSSLMNQACDNLSGKGKIIVMSAGNEGAEPLHLSKTFTAADTVLKTAVIFSSPNYKRTWVDIWGEQGKTFCAKITLYKGSLVGATTGYICLDNSKHDTYIMSGTDTCYIQFISSAAEYNQKPRMTLNVFNRTVDNFVVEVKGTSGTINMWDEYYYYGYTHQYSSQFSSLGITGAVTGNTNTTVSDMGAAKSVLLIGAYTSKTDYTDINNVARTYSGSAQKGKLTSFSSKGPMIDGRIKPDIAAPGLTVATSMSSQDMAYTPTGTQASQLVKEIVSPIDGQKYYYGEFSGTSASAPATSGIVALMLQAHPYLTPQDVKDIVYTTAIEDSYTGDIPDAGNNTWGHGKINAYGAVKLAEKKYTDYFSGDGLNCSLVPNPFTNNFILDYRSNSADMLDVVITGLDGRTISRYKWQTQAGINQQSFDAANLFSGVYFIKVFTPKGNKVFKTVKK